MRVDLARPSPAQLAADLRARRSVERARAEEVNDEMKPAGWRAAHVVSSDGPQVAGAIARLLEELALRRVLETLVPLHVSTGQEPPARERTGGLPRQQELPGALR